MRQKDLCRQKVAIFAVSNKNESKMKKRIISFAVVAIAAAAGWVFGHECDSVLMDLALNKVESSALKNCEEKNGSCWLDADFECCADGELGCAPCGH